MFSVFNAIFAALTDIDTELAKDTGEERRREMIDTLLSLRRNMDKCVQYWLKFEERLNQLQERHHIALPDTLPPSFMEDIALFAENGETAPAEGQAKQYSTGTGKGGEGRAEEREEAETSLASLNSAGAITSFRRGLGFWELAMLPEAAGEFKKVVQEQPDLIIGHFCFGIACAQLGRSEEASRELKLVLALDQNNSLQALVLNTLGVLAAGKERYSQALDYFIRANKVGPELMEAWFNRAAVSYNLQRYAEAVEAFQRARDLAPEDWEINFYLGKACGYLEQYNHALQSLERAYHLNPREPLITFEMGLICRILGRKNQAQCYFHATRRLMEAETAGNRPD